MHASVQNTYGIAPYSLEQLNPSPLENGSLHVHVKFELSNPSLSHTAFISHGISKQGSGTISLDI